LPEKAITTSDGSDPTAILSFDSVTDSQVPHQRVQSYHLLDYLWDQESMNCKRTQKKDRKDDDYMDKDSSNEKEASRVPSEQG